MPIQDIPLDSPIEDRIEWARKCYRTAGQRLLRNEKIVQLLNEIQKAAQQSHSEMGRLGIISACTTCELEGGGSCCGSGLENKYSGILLLINLLCGREIPHKRMDEKSCYFLSRQGCTLLARHVICINYLCQTITQHLDDESLLTLKEMEGIEIDSLFVLNERIKKVLWEIE